MGTDASNLVTELQNEVQLVSKNLTNALDTFRDAVVVCNESEFAAHKGTLMEAFRSETGNLESKFNQVDGLQVT